MKRIVFYSIIVSLIVLGCKSKNNPSWVVDSTQMNSKGINAVVDDINMRVLAITDVENTMSADLFKGSFDDSLLAEKAPDGQFASVINAFLIVRGDDIVLVDAGLGNDKGGNLLAKLNFLGVKPEKVSAVLLTHLHSDHIGGLLRAGMPTFPNADIYLSVEEFNAWADGGMLAERNAQWKEVLASYADKVRPFVDGDTLIDGLAIAMLAPGHTPGHTVYRVGNCLFVGDLVHAEDLQLSYPDFCARYDGDYPQAVMTRKKMIDYATDNRLLMCGAHCYTQPIIIDGSK